MTDHSQRINVKRTRTVLLSNLFTYAAILFWIGAAMWVIGFLVGVQP